MPAVGHHEGKLLGRQRVMQGKPVIDLKAHPRLRSTAMKLADGCRDQARRGRRAATERHFAIFAIVRFPSRLLSSMFSSWKRRA
jgi:hypothetical protein